ncbi:unnamed protein product [Darwinula stevensoni]|uniref:BHLH domain-containing protein n=1 Tax=Darwinula stevensoni TaxID=69355 RepID=A0A7R9AIH8_9CRUS|nr:unnamed protein product [Darwinula stevensoni]CAG0906745.1 unnamed protein product [Darwinula stevensoni]
MSESLDEAACRDDNNNDSNSHDKNKKTGTEEGKREEKYSLRPRSTLTMRITASNGRRKRSRPSHPSPSEDPEPEPQPDGEDEFGEEKTRKSKPAPLSKYRRKNANARERHRMKEINDAFETLRRAIPPFPTDNGRGNLTKITTLRLAINYIKALNEVLHSPPSSLCLSVPEEEPPLSLHSAVSPVATAATNATTTIKLPPVESLFLAKYPPSSMDKDGSNSDPLSLSVFDDDSIIPSLPMDESSFNILLESDGESLVFGSDLSDQATTP